MVALTETDELSPPRGLLTRRAVQWGTDALQDDDITAVARRLDVDLSSRRAGSPTGTGSD